MPDQPLSAQSVLPVWRCHCGFVESEPGACCRKCGTKTAPELYLAKLTSMEAKP